MDMLSSLLGGLLAILLLTSFAKIFTVLSIVKLGVGLEGAGMSAIVAAVALLVSAVAMQPQLEPMGGLEGLLRGELNVSRSVLEEEFRPFLDRHSDPKVVSRLAGVVSGNADSKKAPAGALSNSSDEGDKTAGGAIAKSQPASFSLAALAFLITELREALELGLLFLLPFVVIDLLVVNGLMALGVTNVSSRVVSLPLKLLLFVSVDGWTLIVSKLMGGYS